MQFPSSIRQEFEKEQDGILYIILLAKTPTWIAGSRLKSRVWVVCPFHWRVDTLLTAVSGGYSRCINIRPLPVLFPSEDIVLRINYPFIGTVYHLKWCCRNGVVQSSVTSHPLRDLFSDI